MSKFCDRTWTGEENLNWKKKYFNFNIRYGSVNNLIILLLDYRNETASILLPDNQTIIHVVSDSIKY